ncbi:MAG: FtsX-like permease family protein, partial [Tissierellales bacterium]
NALLSGNFFTELHVKQRSPVAVLGYNMGIGLMRGRNPVGQTITLEGQTYRIVGVLEQKGSGNAEGIDDKIIIPYTSALKIADKRKVDQIWGKAASKEDADLVVVQMGRIFKRKLGLDQTAPSGNTGEEGEVTESVDYYYDSYYGNYDEPTQPVIPSSGEDLITITSLNQLVEEADNANRVMTLLLGGIAAVSLLVGGLGIMNIMLVAVTERTEEIGLRRAIGAKQSDLLLQFILEALYLSAIGAIAGTALGVWSLGLFERYGFSTAVNFQAIEIATIVALFSGLLFGVYPAISASALPPVEALKRQ